MNESKEDVSKFNSSKDKLIENLSKIDSHSRSISDVSDRDYKKEGFLSYDRQTDISGLDAKHSDNLLEKYSQVSNALEIHKELYHFLLEKNKNFENLANQLNSKFFEILEYYENFVENSKEREENNIFIQTGKNDNNLIEKIFEANLLIKSLNSKIKQLEEKDFIDPNTKNLIEENDKITESLKIESENSKI